MATYTISPLLKSHCSLRFFFICFCTIWATQSFATSLVLNIQDPAGQGLNDTTPANAVGGNIGSSIGEQRRIAFEFATTLIETVFNSSVTITINASFSALTCTANSATLGQGGPNGIYRHDSSSPNIPFPENNTWYVEALANSYKGSDLSTAADMDITFNSNIDNNNNCLNNRNWYYGLDGNPAGSDIDFLSTVLHEIIHGLGFISFTHLSTGALTSNYDDIYSSLLEDHSLANNWQKNQMNNAERAFSATDDPDLHWSGSNIQAASSTLTAGLDQGHVRMHAPSSLSSGSSVSHFSTALSPNELMEPILNGPVQSIGLAEQLLVDIGWNTFNNPVPLIATISDLTVLNSSSETVNIVILDNDTTSTALIVTANSSNGSIISNANLVFSGSGRLRQLDITAENGMSGAVQITITVSDSSNSTDTSFIVNVVPQLPPVISISSPANNAELYSSPQSFIGTAIDNEDGDISAQINWNSSLDGNLGNGANINPTLSDGNHTITASITDSDGNNPTDSINIIVSLAGDADSDGLSNSLEIILGTDPNNSDSDGDYISDFIELNRDGDPSNYTPGVDTDPNNADTDGDGYNDGVDIDPLDPNSVQVNVPAMPSWAMYMLIIILGTMQRRTRIKPKLL